MKMTWDREGLRRQSGAPQRGGELFFGKLLLFEFEMNFGF